MAIPRLSKVAVTLLLFIIKSYAFQSVKVPKQGRLRLSSTTENTQNDVIEELISSNEIQNVFTLLMRNPTISLSPEQSTLLLNNLNVLAKISSGNDVSKFYQRLQKAGKAIPSFGTMVLDGPLSELTLPKFEVLMTVDPTFLQTATELKESSYSSLLIPNELGVMASAARSSLEIRIKLQVQRSTMIKSIINPSHAVLIFHLNFSVEDILFHNKDFYFVLFIYVLFYF